MDLNIAIKSILKAMEDFEGEETKHNIGAGSRVDGKKYEDLISDLWTLVKSFAEQQGATSSIVRNKSRNHVKLSVKNRSLYIPLYGKHTYDKKEENSALNLSFFVKDIKDKIDSAHNNTAQDYAPRNGVYAGSNYPKMYEGMQTKFDDTIVFEDNGNVVEKLLLEYKTSKASNGKKLDGNAHERLSFQMCQYANIVQSGLYKNCSLVVIGNGAFQRYRNKYHLSFHMQEEMLRKFIPGFSCKFAFSKIEYTDFLVPILSWLFKKEV